MAEAHWLAHCCTLRSPDRKREPIPWSKHIQSCRILLYFHQNVIQKHKWWRIIFGSYRVSIADQTALQKNYLPKDIFVQKLKKLISFIFVLYLTCNRSLSHVICSFCSWGSNLPRLHIYYATNFSITLAKTILLKTIVANLRKTAVVHVPACRRHAVADANAQWSVAKEHLSFWWWTGNWACHSAGPWWLGSLHPMLCFAKVVPTIGKSRAVGQPGFKSMSDPTAVHNH
jgi:hypothetical protein